MSTRTININEFWDGEGNPEVVIKRLTFGGQNAILDEVSNVSVKGRNVEVSPRYGRMRDLTLSRCIVSAPFPITLEYIENELPIPLGEFLFNEIDKFNNFRKEKKELSEVAGKT